MRNFNPKIKPNSRCFVAGIFYKGWWEISFGINIDFKSPNIEIHLPVIYILLGWRAVWIYENPQNNA